MTVLDIVLKYTSLSGAKCVMHLEVTPVEMLGQKYELRDILSWKADGEPVVDRSQLSDAAFATMMINQAESPWEEQPLQQIGEP